MKIAYLSGPADGPAIYNEWKNSTQDYFGTDYMRQYLQLSNDLKAKSYIVTWHGDKAYQRSFGDTIFDNRPFSNFLHYYINRMWWQFKILLKFIAFRPDLVVLTGNHTFWWILSPLRLLGATFLPSFHSTLWLKLGRTKMPWRFLLQLDRFFILRHCPVVVATSHDIGRQVEALVDAEVIYHLPTWAPEQFASIPPPQHNEPFRILFAGRIENNKGIWDVLEMARQIPDVLFEVCGTGGELERAQSSSPGNVTFHGFCGRDKMPEIMGRCQVCIVPTRSDCEAGFEMTCAEAILAGRPLITSAVAPALEYLAPASVEVEFDNVEAYVEAIRSLRDDKILYAAKQQATLALAEQFYDPARSWLTAMKTAVSRIRSLKRLSPLDVG